MQLQEADAGETQKSFLIRSEEARFVYFPVILVRMLISLGEKKSLSWAFESWGHLKGGVETPKKYFQI